jgi:hypothetical protein
MMVSLPGELFTYPVTKTLDGLLRIGYSPLLRQSLLAGNKPLKEAKSRFKISIDALYFLNAWMRVSMFTMVSLPYSLLGDYLPTL